MPDALGFEGNSGFVCHVCVQRCATEYTWQKEAESDDLFGRDQFAAIAERLASIKGRFILSINDVPEVRAVFKGFVVEEVALKYSIGGGMGTHARELIIHTADNERSRSP